MKAITAAKIAPEIAVREAYKLTMTPAAVARLSEIKEAVLYAQEQTEIASTITVTDDTSNAAAADVVVNLSKTAKAVEELRKFYTDPLEQAKKGIIATFKKMGADAAGQEDRLRGELGAYFQKKENERRAAESKRIADEQERQKKARALGRAAPAPIAAPVTPEVERTTQTDNGSLNIGLEWALLGITDPALVPRQYLSVDEKKIRAAVAEGVRTIPGVLIGERPRTSAR